MELRLLGPVELVGDDGQPIKLPAGKAERLRREAAAASAAGRYQYEPA